MFTAPDVKRGDIIHLFANDDLFDLEVVNIDDEEVIVNHLGDNFVLNFATFADWTYTVTHTEGAL